LRADCPAAPRRARARNRGFGVHAHREIRTNFDASAFRRAWLIDGRLAALFGVTGALLASRGYGWLALTSDATRYPVEIVKETRRQFDQIMLTKREMVTALLPEDKTALRFATKLGFEIETVTPVPYGRGRVIAARYKGASLAGAA
jgi:hypothetical protein